MKIIGCGGGGVGEGEDERDEGGQGRVFEVGVNGVPLEVSGCFGGGVGGSWRSF